MFLFFLGAGFFVFVFVFYFGGNQGPCMREIDMCALCKHMHLN